MNLSVSFIKLFIFLVAVSVAPALADPFGGFERDGLSAPKTAGKVKDPTGASPAKPVYGFHLPAGFCSDTPYQAGGEESDCFYNSSRSQMVESGRKQPKEAWYGWNVYFPEDFPYGARQTKGHYEFAYWHNDQCPHLTFASDAGSGDMLYLKTNRALGNYECETVSREPIVSLKTIAGRWTRFETHIKWSSGEDGLVEVFLDGELVLTQAGPNLTKGYEKKNYFKFGLYLCCTEDVSQIRDARVYFSGVKRAGDRSGLN